MNLILRRTSYEESGVYGRLSSEDGGMICWTLEHSYAKKLPALAPHIAPEIHHCAKVPVGTYRCVRGMHRLSKGEPFETFELQKVPGHWGILFHKGNFEEDSSGCILLGMELWVNEGKKGIAHSLAAFRTFMQAQGNVNEFFLTVEDE